MKLMKIISDDKAFFPIVTNDLDHLKSYNACEIYKIEHEELVLIKPNNISWIESGIDPFGKTMYIGEEAKKIYVKQERNRLGKEFLNCIHVDQLKAKQAITKMFDLNLNEPKLITMTDSKDDVDLIVGEFLEDAKLVENLIKTSLHDFSTAVHLTNTVLFMFNFTKFMGMSENLIKELCLISLVHDFGKRNIPDYILQSQRKLTDEEFDIIKKHPKDGRKILEKNGFSKRICIPTETHHEKLDGSGYYGLTNISVNSQLLTIVDIFEALTNERPYKAALKFFSALGIIKNEEVNNGKISSKHFEIFAKSLVNLNIFKE